MSSSSLRRRPYHQSGSASSAAPRVHLVTCDSCFRGNFFGKRYKCLICYDFDICSICYDALHQQQPFRDHHVSASLPPPSPRRLPHHPQPTASNPHRASRYPPRLVSNSRSSSSSGSALPPLRSPTSTAAAAALPPLRSPFAHEDFAAAAAAAGVSASFASSMSREESHSASHPMQCVLTRGALDVFFGGDDGARGDVIQCFTCPRCGEMGLTEAQLFNHVHSYHSQPEESEVICPICCCSPTGDGNLSTDDLWSHFVEDHGAAPERQSSQGSTRPMRHFRPARSTAHSRTRGGLRASSRSDAGGGMSASSRSDAGEGAGGLGGVHLPGSVQVPLPDIYFVPPPPPPTASIRVGNPEPGASGANWFATPPPDSPVIDANFILPREMEHMSLAGSREMENMSLAASREMESMSLAAPPLISSATSAFTSASGGGAPQGRGGRVVDPSSSLASALLGFLGSPPMEPSNFLQMTNDSASSPAVIPTGRHAEEDEHEDEDEDDDDEDDEDAVIEEDEEIMEEEELDYYQASGDPIGELLTHLTTIHRHLERNSPESGSAERRSGSSAAASLFPGLFPSSSSAGSSRSALEDVIYAAAGVPPPRGHSSHRQTRMVSSTSSRNGGARPTAAASSASNALLDAASAALFNAATSTNYVSLRGEPKDDRFLLSQFDLWDDTDAKGRSEEEKAAFIGSLLLESLTQNISANDDVDRNLLLDSSSSAIWPFSEPSGRANSRAEPTPSVSASSETAVVPTASSTSLPPSSSPPTHLPPPPPPTHLPPPPPPSTVSNGPVPNFNADRRLKTVDKAIDHAGDMVDDDDDDISPFPLWNQRRNDSATSTVSSGVLTMQFSTSSQNSCSSSPAASNATCPALSSSSSASNFGAAVGGKDVGGSVDGPNGYDVDDSLMRSPISERPTISCIARDGDFYPVNNDAAFSVNGAAIPFPESVVNGPVLLPSAPTVGADGDGESFEIDNKPIDNRCVAEALENDDDDNRRIVRDVERVAPGYTMNSITLPLNTSLNRARTSDYAGRSGVGERGEENDQEVEPDLQSREAVLASPEYMPLSPPTSPSDVTLAPRPPALSPRDEFSSFEADLSSTGATLAGATSSSDVSGADQDLSLPRPCNGVVSADSSVTSIVTVLQGIPTSGGGSSQTRRQRSSTATSSSDEGTSSHPIAAAENEELLGAAGGMTPPSVHSLVGGATGGTTPLYVRSRLPSSASQSSVNFNHPLSVDGRDKESEGMSQRDSRNLQDIPNQSQHQHLLRHDRGKQQQTQQQQTQQQQQQQLQQHQNRPFGLVGSTGSRNKKKSKKSLRGSAPGVAEITSTTTTTSKTARPSPTTTTAQAGTAESRRINRTAMLNQPPIQGGRERQPGLADVTQPQRPRPHLPLTPLATASTGAAEYANADPQHQ